ncbi:hypothetical protein B0H17DRAFT_1052426 [Mycena rosella]|uniref:Uncharacterized protein n=1 Tax=Mycena rosella TaxID=1033263 RepID=A0AAD7DSH5_MYCRO|nr:hypothetical protein B0H17DRAFT_1052426 [Mycena rosella]
MKHPFDNLNAINPPVNSADSGGLGFTDGDGKGLIEAWLEGGLREFQAPVKNMTKISDLLSSSWIGADGPTLPDLIFCLGTHLATIIETTSTSFYHSSGVGALDSPSSGIVKVGLNGRKPPAKHNRVAWMKGSKIGLTSGGIYYTCVVHRLNNEFTEDKRLQCVPCCDCAIQRYGHPARRCHSAGNMQNRTKPHKQKRSHLPLWTPDSVKFTNIFTTNMRGISSLKHSKFRPVTVNFTVRTT